MDLQLHPGQRAGSSRQPITLDVGTAPLGYLHFPGRPHFSSSLVICEERTGEAVGVVETDKAAFSEITYQSLAMCSALPSEKC